MSILVQGVAIVTEAHVGANGIATLVLTASIVHGTLVNVRKEYGGEAGALHWLIRMEFDAQRITVRRGGGGMEVPQNVPILLRRFSVSLE